MIVLRSLSCCVAAVSINTEVAPFQGLIKPPLLRLPENAHLQRYPHPSSLRRTPMYASLLGISEALHLDIFHQPLRKRFFESLVRFGD
jgi:hypothetical protein